jgi:hypothetical protein
MTYLLLTCSEFISGSVLESFFIKAMLFRVGKNQEIEKYRKDSQ